ncbi:MAG: PAS domain S-box protein, partial [Methylomonas sp.]
MKNSFNRSFIFFMLIICCVIAVPEGLIMLLLEELRQWGLVLTRLEEAAIDTLLLTVLAAPLLWLSALRPLAKKINDQQVNQQRYIQYNQELLKALDIHALVSITDLKGRITHVNRQFCEVSGYSESELLGQNHRLVNSGYHNEDFFSHLWRKISIGEHWRGEVRNRNKQGSFYWVDTTVVPLMGGDGKPMQYISILSDITKIKENENRLLTLKRALDASSEMILVADDHGCIQYVNPALCGFTGWKEEQILGRPPNIFDSPSADCQTLAQMQSHLRQGKPWSGRLLNRRSGAAPLNIAGQAAPPDEREYWAEINITTIRNDSSELLGYVQIQRDISDQVNKEQAMLLANADTAARLSIANALQQALPLQERMVQVLDILFNLKAFDLQRKGGIFLKDPDRDVLEKFVLHGNFSEEFMRCGQRIAVGECLCGGAAVSQELIVSDNCYCDPRHEHVFKGMIAHGHYIVPIVSAGVTLGIMFLYTDPYPVRLDSRLDMLRYVGDMTALAFLQEQSKKTLESARDAAEQAAKIKAEFLANMSHEIRTPMNGVLGMLDMIKDTDMTGEQQDLIETAANSAESLLIVINDILDFSKLEAGKIELERIEFNLPMLVEEVCALMSGRAHDKGLDLNCFLPLDLPPLWQGDPNRIRQILTNLIGNAVKFTDHGEVSIKAVVDSVVHGEPLVRFEIKDTGIGLSPEGQARLFQPFSQADSSTARRFGGTGLGLSISKNLIEIMQGSIGVESALGQGACFWFSLPLEAVYSADMARNTDLTGKRALIVDDNATNRRILHHYLEHWGMSVSEADNAPAALQALEDAVKDRHGFDILLSDLHMPGMDGYALARAIALNPLISAIPRLLLSSGGLGSKADREELGFTQTLLKPVRQAHLLAAITGALQAFCGETAAPAKIDEQPLDYNQKSVLVVEDNKVNQ